MYSIIQKIYEKNKEILKEGVKKVLNGEDVSTLTGSIKEFTDILGQELFSEIVTQIDNLIFEDTKRKRQYESVRFADKSLITKNGKAKFERRYYKDKETSENVCLTDKVLGLEKGERIDKKVKSELIKKANDQSYHKSGKLVVPNMDISSTTVMRSVRKNEWKMEIQERKEEEKREKKIEELEKRIRKKANKKLFGTVGAKIPIEQARDELYYELKNIWYGKAVYIGLK